MNTRKVDGFVIRPNHRGIESGASLWLAIRRTQPGRSRYFTSQVERVGDRDMTRRPKVELTGDEESNLWCFDAFQVRAEDVSSSLT